MDPARCDKRSGVLAHLMQAGGWSRAEPTGAWSYSGKNGNTSRVDHALFRGSVQVSSAGYVAESLAPQHTDHAALIIERARPVPLPTLRALGVGASGIRRLTNDRWESNARMIVRTCPRRGR